MYPGGNHSSQSLASRGMSISANSDSKLPLSNLGLSERYSTTIVLDERSGEIRDERAMAKRRRLRLPVQPETRDFGGIRNRQRQVALAGILNENVATCSACPAAS